MFDVAISNSRVGKLRYTLPTANVVVHTADTNSIFGLIKLAVLPNKTKDKSTRKQPVDYGRK